MDFHSEHNLDFEVAPYHIQMKGFPEQYRFRVGTCNGLWCVSDTSYMIIAVMNEKQGNGHLIDVFQWFENSCKRDNKSLMVLAIVNERFKKHLIEKRSFKEIPNDSVIKTF